MKLAIFFILLISLSACKNFTVNPSGGNSDSSSGGPPAPTPALTITEKAKAILDVESDLIKILKDDLEITKDISKELKDLKDAANDIDRQAALKALVKIFDETKDAKNGGVILHYAENEKVVKALIAAGADVNAKNNEGQTPLHYEEDEKVVKALIAAGANKDITDNLGQTPYDVAETQKIKDLLNSPPLI